MHIPDHVLHAYALSPVSQLERLGGTKNSNFKVTDPQSGRTLFLRRRHADYSAPAWVRFDHAALSHLAAHCNSVCPPLTPAGARMGETWLVEAGEVYEAFPFIGGRAFDPDDGGDIGAVADALAALHSAGRDFPHQYVKGALRGETAPSRLLGLCDRFMDEHPEARDELTFLRQQVTLGDTRLPDASYLSLPATLNHGDVHPGNLILQSNQVVFVDFDWVGRQPVVYDVANALLFLCTDRPGPIGDGDIWSLTQPFTFNPGKLAKFLSRYQQAARLRVDPAWLSALYEQMRLTWAHCRLDGARKVPPAKRKVFWARDLTAPFEWLEARVGVP